MRTGYWFALIGSIAAMAVFACSSSDSGPTIVGKGGGIAKGGGAGNPGQGGGTAQGGSGQGGGTAQGGSGQGGAGQGGQGQGGGTAGQGGGTAGTGGGGTCDPAAKIKSAECSGCYSATTLCASEKTACQNDTACAAYASCLDACQDAACQDACATSNGAGMPKYYVYVGCAESACHDQCRCGECGMMSDTPCGNCGDTKCTAECSTCAKNALCVGVWMCYSYCPATDTACQNACFQAPELAAGVDPLMAFLGSSGCISTNCATECQP